VTKCKKQNDRQRRRKILAQVYATANDKAERWSAPAPAPAPASASAPSTWLLLKIKQRLEKSFFYFSFYLIAIVFTSRHYLLK